MRTWWGPLSKRQVWTTQPFTPRRLPAWGWRPPVTPEGVARRLLRSADEIGDLSGECVPGGLRATEGHAMPTRHLIAVLIAVVVSLGALTPLRGAALPDDGEPDPLPVRGAVLPAGSFVGTLRIVAGTVDAAGQRHLTG